MLNVIELREKAPRSRASTPQHFPQNVDADISGLAARITGLHAQAKGGIHDAVLMLDLAAQHARLAAKRVSDLKLKDDYDQHISTIERLLQVARDTALKL